MILQEQLDQIEAEGDKLFLSKRNLLTLLSKLHRKEHGDTTACTIVKYKNLHDPLVNTIDKVTVTAVPDEEFYTTRPAGAMHPSDDPWLAQVKLKRATDLLTLALGALVSGDGKDIAVTEVTQFLQKEIQSEYPSV